MSTGKFAALIVMVGWGVAASAAEPVVGFRNDLTGHYPGTTPPLEWGRDAAGAEKNISWRVRMPQYSFASPLVVGDRLFVRCEPYDLVCMDKNTGRVLWWRSHGPNVLATAEDKKSEDWPAVEAAATELEKVNGEIYGAPNAAARPLLDRQRQLQKSLNDSMAKVNRKGRIAPELWRGKWAGYTGSTPCSDGKAIYFCSLMGVVGSYDLDGNARWIVPEPVSVIQIGEHGSGSSPTLVGDLMVYCLNSSVVAVDKDTGALRWRAKINGGDPNPSPIGFDATGQTVLLAKGQFIDPKDGSLLFQDPHAKAMACNATPVIHGDCAYFLDAAGRVLAIDWARGPDGKLAFKRRYLTEFPLEDKSQRWESKYNVWVPSPLLVDGRVYCLSNQGRLVVVDAAGGQIVHDKLLDLDPDIYTSGMHGAYIVGCCASPALAGGRMYVSDNRFTVLAMEPGAEPKVLAKNKVVQKVEPWDVKHFDHVHQESTLASPVFDGRRVYVRGELYVYCIGEK